MLTGRGYGRQQSFTPLSVERVCGKQQRQCSKTLYERRVQTALPKQSAGARDYRNKSARGDASAEIYGCSHNSDRYGAGEYTRDLEATSY
jgi:hypothetical protein